MDPTLILPRELVQDILQLCQEPSQVGFPGPQLKQEAPWVFSYVSSRWRQLVLSSPTLWSKISITLPYSEKSARNYKNIAHLVLERSQSASVAVLLCKEHAGAEQLLLHEDLLMAAVRASHRWSSFRLLGDLSDPQIDILASVRPHTLTQLDLSRSGATGRLLDVFEQASRLRVVRLFSIPETDGTRFPWAHIVNMTLNFGDSDLDWLLRTISERLSSLETLSLNKMFDLPMEDLPAASQTYTLFTLKTLCITPTGSAFNYNPGVILDRIVTPALSTLSLDIGSSSVASSITALITRSSCSATFTSLSLTIPANPFLAIDDASSSGAFNAADLLPLFQHTPALSHLHLAGTRTDVALLRALTLPAPTDTPEEALPPLLPALASLAVTSTHNALLSLVGSRFAPAGEEDAAELSRTPPLPRTLKRVRLAAVDLQHVGAELAHGFYEMEQLGLDVGILRLED
ncbi:F-box domain-containing protein [Mycena kentingensis (nom. inval.)]|nr:F-box domain-containing protein [Mycena kentingensis (nom. inval.)]